MIEEIIFVIALIIMVIYLSRKQMKLKEVQKELEEYKHLYKSGLVKFGKSFEHFIPFSKEYPGNREKSVFLGMPIDYISFDEDSIKFIECKTGNSQLNANQKRVKELVENKKVEWHEVRYNEF